MDTAITRLPIQERLLIEQMEGVFPEKENNLQDFTRVLDVACGTGTWALQVAQENPHLEVIGVECHRQLVQYATCLAKARRVENVSFVLLQENMRSLPFPNGHFDLVNAHFLFTLLSAGEWSGVVQEYLRVTRSGGYLRLIEPEWGTTNNQAFEEFKRLFLRSFKRRGYGLSSDEEHIGAAFFLCSFLKLAGATEISQRFSVCNYWTEPRRSSNPAKWIEMIAQSVRPLFLSEGVMTQMDFDHLIQSLIKEVTCPSFSEIAYVLSACGQKTEDACEEINSLKDG